MTRPHLQAVSLSALQEIAQLQKRNREQAIAIEGFQRAILEVRQEMETMKAEHMKQLLKQANAPRKPRLI